MENEDMGYEEAAPSMPRRQSSSTMSEEEQVERRASIQAIMADETISPMAKRLSIQHLMDGRRNSMNNGSASSKGGVAGSESPHNSTSSSNETSTFNISADTSAHGYEHHDVVPDHNHHDRDHHPGSAANAGNNDGCSYYYYYYSNEHTRRTELARPHCPHYDRKCTLIAPCCGAAFGCRICHDDCPNLPAPKKVYNSGSKYNNNNNNNNRSASLPSGFTSMSSNSNSNSNDPSYESQDTHHNIDRFAVREVVCRECYTRQSSKTNNCVSCGVQFGDYHCSICNLWMSNADAPYHCEDCGFCRVGGADNFSHCHDCGMCIAKDLLLSSPHDSDSDNNNNNHNCKAGKYCSNCPVCQEYLFSSRSASHEMPCGHAIHWDCFCELAMHDSRCPVCKKTAETRERMMPTWNAMAAGIALQPVPLELSRVVNITCNDCEKPEQQRAWHFLGVQCNHCSSFNTVVDEIVMTGDEAHRFLEERTRTETERLSNRARHQRRRMDRRRSAFS